MTAGQGISGYSAGNEFKGHRFPKDLILLSVCWYLRFGPSDRDSEAILEQRGLRPDLTSVYLWVRKFTSELVKTFNQRKVPVGARWRLDETYIKVNGQWRYLYRAVNNIDHTILLRALARHCDTAWVTLYIRRWLVAPLTRADGTCVPRTVGIPQGGVVSPLLANLFLHYAFDAWMRREFPGVNFCRSADDAVIHCRTEAQAKQVLGRLGGRLKECQLELHPQKTKIVYCADADRRQSYPNWLRGEYGRGCRHELVADVSHRGLLEFDKLFRRLRASNHLDKSQPAAARVLQYVDVIDPADYRQHFAAPNASTAASLRSVLTKSPARWVRRVTVCLAARISLVAESQAEPLVGQE